MANWRKMFAALAALAAIAGLAVGIPAASADNIGGDGGGAACQVASGSIPWWVTSDQSVEAGGCPSYRSGFYVYQQGAPTQNCLYTTAYHAYVKYVDNNGNWHDRWDGGAYCLDGTWRYSSSWSYNEKRVTILQIWGIHSPDQHDTAWGITQYSY
jgi:hypothetical protein